MVEPSQGTSSKPTVPVPVDAALGAAAMATVRPYGRRGAWFGRPRPVWRVVMHPPPPG